MIDLEVVLTHATNVYNERKGRVGGELPSDQIRALAEALVAAVNWEFEIRDNLDREVRERG